MYLSQQIAAEAIEHVLGGRNLTSTLESVFRRHPHITPQQRAVAQDLSYGALRFYGELEALLQQLLQKPLTDQRLHCLLLVAMYQLNHDRAAAHTIVDQAVKAAGLFKMQWAKGLVNAVLRNFLRQEAALKQALGTDEVAKFSYPQWWVDKVRAQYPTQWQAMLEAGNQHPPLTLRVNLARTTPQDFCTRLETQGIPARVLAPQAVMLEKAMPVEKIPGFLQGEVSVQDAGAQHAGRLLDVKDGMRVLDACCAPGGKTGHILERADVDLVALDVDAARLARVQENLDRLHLAATRVEGDAAQPDAWWDGRPFDRILADVPCSASGVVRRNPDIKWLRRPEDIPQFVAQQAVMLEALWRLLAPGGTLLYATCSIFHEENAGQVQAFLARHAGDAERCPLPEPLSDGVLLPAAEHDGFYYALLRKT